MICLLMDSKLETLKGDPEELKEDRRRLCRVVERIMEDPTANGRSGGDPFVDRCLGRDSVWGTPF